MKKTSEHFRPEGYNDFQTTIPTDDYIGEAFKVFGVLGDSLISIGAIWNGEEFVTNNGSIIEDIFADVDDSKLTSFSPELVI